MALSPKTSHSLLTSSILKKAFDSIDRDMMFAMIEHYGIPNKIVSAIRVLYDQSTSQVYIQGQLSEAFDFTTGVLQGDVLAPFIFIVVIHRLCLQKICCRFRLSHSQR